MTETTANDAAAKKKFDPSRLTWDGGFLKSPKGRYYYLTGRRYFRLPLDEDGSLRARIKNEHKTIMYGLIILAVVFCKYTKNFSMPGYRLILLAAMMVACYFLILAGRKFITRGLDKVPVQQTWRNVHENKARLFHPALFVFMGLFLLGTGIYLIPYGKATYEQYKTYHAANNFKQTENTEQPAAPALTPEQQRENEAYFQKELGMSEAEAMGVISHELSRNGEKKKIRNEAMETDSLIRLVIAPLIVILAFMFGVYAFYLAHLSFAMRKGAV